MLFKQPYPFDPSDREVFSWEWLFDDADSVASYTLTPDTGLTVESPTQTANVVSA